MIFCFDRFQYQDLSSGFDEFFMFDESYIFSEKFDRGNLSELFNSLIGSWRHQ